MVAIQPPRAADRQADPVDRKRIVLPQRRQLPMRRTARAHVILGVDFKETQRRAGFADGGEMFGLEADARRGWQRSHEDASFQGKRPGRSGPGRDIRT